MLPTSDNMAIGVIKAAKEKGWVPGKDFITGGIDLLPQNQHYLKNGLLDVSVGGHYADGAWALIAIYDYLKGYDFADFGQTQFKTKMAVHSSNTFAKLGDLRKKLSSDYLKKIDFRRFSRAYNPAIKQYQFDIERLLAQ